MSAMISRPSSAVPPLVLAFFWVSVAIAFVWIATDLYGLKVLADVSGTVPAARPKTVQAWLNLIAIPGAIWCALIVGLSWAATFRQKNWARWGFLGVALISQSSVFIWLLHISSVKWESWRAFQSILVLALFVAAILLVFGKSAKRWFATH